MLVNNNKDLLVNGTTEKPQGGRISKEEAASIFENSKLELPSTVSVSDSEALKMLQDIDDETEDDEKREFNPADGKLDDTKQGRTGDCWLLAGANALRYTESGREIIKNALEYDENGTTVHLLGSGDFYITNEELEAAKDNEKYSTGDVDMLMFELAIEKARKEVQEGKVSYTNINSQSHYIVSDETIKSGQTYESLYYITGRTSETAHNENEKLDFLERFAQDGGKNITITCSNSYDDGEFPDADGNIITLADRHAYSVKSYEDGIVTVINPWDTSEEIRLNAYTFMGIFEQVFLTDLSQDIDPTVKDTTPPEITENEDGTKTRTIINKDGEVIRTDTLDKDGKCIKTEFTYEDEHKCCNELIAFERDEEGNVTKSVTEYYHDINEPTRKSILDIDDNLIQSTFYHDGKIVQIDRYDGFSKTEEYYDKNGAIEKIATLIDDKTLTEEWFDGDLLTCLERYNLISGELFSTTNYVYDDNDILEYSVVQYSDMTIETLFEYDENGVNTKQTSTYYNEEGDEVGTNVSKIEDDKKVQTDFYVDDVKTGYAYFTYDEDGFERIVNQTELDDKGNATSNTIQLYSPNGNKETQITRIFDEQGKTASIESKRYTYDEDLNVTGCTMVTFEIKNGKIEGFKVKMLTPEELEEMNDV